MIICLEGPDGCGKTSIALAVAKRLGAEVITFPNDDAFTGPTIRSYLRKRWEVWEQPTGTPNQMRVSTEIGALAFQALQIANRMELMPRLASASLQGKSDLVLARYWQSAWVYGQLDGLPTAWLEQVHESMIQPDFNILLDLDAEQCMKRRAARDGALPPERYEGKLDFTKKVVELYRQLWNAKRAESNYAQPTPLWLVVDASKPFEQVVDNAMHWISQCHG